MCTFKNERTVQVCDVAIEKVRRTLAGAFGNDVSFTHVEGAGTLVKAAAPVDPEGFSRLAREAIASAENEEAEHASN
ncbi:MAG TPA: hypothetical protein VIP09_08270 [Dehalococcoidia bacterium]|jgi:hypothetical protein